MFGGPGVCARAIGSPPSACSSAAVNDSSAIAAIRRARGTEEPPPPILDTSVDGSRTGRGSAARHQAALERVGEGTRVLPFQLEGHRRLPLLEHLEPTRHRGPNERRDVTSTLTSLSRRSDHTPTVIQADRGATSSRRSDTATTEGPFDPIARTYAAHAIRSPVSSGSSDPIFSTRVLMAIANRGRASTGCIDASRRGLEAGGDGLASYSR